MRRRPSRCKEQHHSRWLSPFASLLVYIFLHSLLFGHLQAHPMIKHMLAQKYGGGGGKNLFLGIKGVLVPIPIPMKVSIPDFKLPSIMFGKGDSGGDSGDVEEKVKYIPVPVPSKGGGGKGGGGGWKGGGGGDWRGGGGGDWKGGGGGDWNGGGGDWKGGGGGGDWKGGGGGGGEDWSSGGGWASSHLGWHAPPEGKVKGNRRPPKMKAEQEADTLKGRRTPSSSKWKGGGPKDWKEEFTADWDDDQVSDWHQAEDWDPGWQAHANDATSWDDGGWR